MNLLSRIWPVLFGALLCSAAAITGCECKSTEKIEWIALAPAHAPGDVVSIPTETFNAALGRNVVYLRSVPPTLPPETYRRQGTVLKVRRADKDSGHSWDYEVLLKGGEKIWHHGPMTAVPNPGIDEWYRCDLSRRVGSIEADVTAIRAKVAPYEEPPAPDAPAPPPPAPTP